MANPWAELLSTPAVVERAPTEESLVKKMLAKKGATPSNEGDKALLDMLLQKQQQDANALRGNVDAFEELPVENDISPLLGLIDTWTGSNFTKNYKKPLTPHERLKEIAALRKAAGDQQGDIAKTQLGLTGAGAKQDTALLATLARMAGDSAGFKKFNQDFKIGQEVGGKVNKLRDEITAEVSNYNLLNDIVDEGSVQKVRASLSNLARTIGKEKGNMAEGDVARQLLPTLEGTIRQLDAYITSNPNAKLDPATIAPIKEVISQSREALYSALKGKLAGHKRTYNSRKEMADYMASSGEAMLDSLQDDFVSLRSDPDLERPAGTPLSLWAKATPEVRAQIVQAEAMKEEAKKNKK
jgi:hypothetical protein